MELYGEWAHVVLAVCDSMPGEPSPLGLLPFLHPPPPDPLYVPLITTCGLSIIHQMPITTAAVEPEETDTDYIHRYYVSLNIYDPL